MGSGFYSSVDRSARASFMGYDTKSASEIFKQRNINNAMDPFNVGVRESRDSDDHPEALAIILALDVTGSMGSIPHHLIKEGLPTLMETVLNEGVKDPQVLFLGIGDHKVDTAPLQVGQFESSDELLDKWLQSIYLEGGGGANEGESYPLAWYFAAKNTSIDCFEKRGKKGILFTIGDEPALKDYSQSSLKNLMGDGEFRTYTSYELLEEASKMYDVYHIHVAQTRAGSMQETIDGWFQLMRDNLIVVENYKDIPSIMARKIIEVTNKAPANVFNSPVVNEPSDFKITL